MNTSTDRFVHSLADLRDDAAEHLRDVIAEVKPKLRGWLHLATAPLALAAGIVLVALSPTAATRIGSAIFAGTAVVLFAVSATYHRGNWGPRAMMFLRRFDHSNIFLLIAGSYTPFSLILLDGWHQVTMLAVVWSGAILGVAFKIFLPTAPRWLHAPIYIALGWAALPFIPQFAAGSEKLGLGIGIATLVLVAAGGLLYTLGGVVYGLKRPNPWPQHFGFHEVFHTFTILAFVSHYVGVSLATYALR
ncbi:PAQR family membrane homeostasis protein TrhA [Nocardioides limicola]|uniref:PAQR family membrane homeostasis protein TrhA n=1 Tax=Nocardioides limicola TaxID=2803368 RepID=UPI0027DC6A7E|nr:hemolysin III family protein [Nocardioides sp. DJM-14]